MKRMARILTTVILLGFLTPVTYPQMTYAATPQTITKTFTVLKPDGTPYQGALVQLYYQVAITKQEVYSTPVTTSASGVASITIPSNIMFVQYQVEPAAGDVTNAILTGHGYGPGEDISLDESVTLTLHRSNMVVQILQPDGVTPGELNFSNVAYPSSDPGFKYNFSWQTRTGPFGIYLASSLFGNYDLRVSGNTLQSNLNQYYWRYGLTASGDPTNPTFTVFTDISNTLIYTPISGVYNLVLRQANIKVQLKDASGNNISVPSGVTAWYITYLMNANGGADNSVPRTTTRLTNGGIAANGSFYARAEGNIAGKYVIVVHMEGSDTLPTFGGYFWEDASGKFSSSGTPGTYVGASAISPFQLDLEVPTANFKATFTKPGNSNADAGYVWITGSQAKYGGFAQSFTVRNGKLSLALPDDTYSISYYSDDPDIGWVNYSYVVSANTGTLKNSTNTLISLTGSSYILSGQPTNVKLLAMDPTGSSKIPNTNIDIYRNADGSGGFVTNIYTTNTYASASLPDGTYQIRMISPSASFAGINYVLTITGGVPSVAGLTPINNIIQLPLGIPNLQLKLVDENNTPANGWYEFCSDTNLGPWQTGSCSGYGFDVNGLTALLADNGNYYLKIHPQSITRVVNVYSVSVTGGIANVAGAQQSNGIWTLSGAIPNLLFDVSHPVTHALLSEGWINIEKIDASGNWLAWLPNADLNPQFPGKAQTLVPDGKYLVKVNVNSGSLATAGLAAKTYSLDVVAGVTTLSLDGVALVKDPTSNRYSVSPSTSNAIIRLVDSSNAPLVGAWFDVCKDLGYGPDKTGTCDGYGVDQNGQWGVNIPTGNWYIRLNPGPNSSLATKMYSASVDASGIVNIVGATKSGEVWILPAGTPNISGSLLTSDGLANVTFMNGQGMNVQVQKFNEIKSNWEGQSNNQWRTAPTFGLNVSGAGRYRLMAWPNGFTDYSITFSSEFFVDGSNNVSTSLAGTYSSTLTNFNIRMNSPNVKFEVKNPIDSSLLGTGWISILKVDPITNNQTWVGNADLNNQYPGLTGFYLDPGTYRLEVNPQFGNTTIAGLSRANYKAVVTDAGSGAVNVVVTGFNDSINVPKDGIRFVVNPLASNVSGRLTTSTGAPLTFPVNSWINLNVQKIDANGNWNWTDQWFNVNNDGFFNINVSTPGSYRLRVEPQGFPNATVTFSQQFDITAANASTFKKDFGNIPLNAPDLVVQVETSTGSTPINDIGIEIRQNDRWLDWAGTGSSGIGTISFSDAGTYQLVVHPNSDPLASGSTTNQYSVTVTKDGAGVKTASVTGAPTVNGLTVLRLGTAALSGLVVSPTSLPIQNAQVVPTDSNGQDLWQYSANTSATGSWAMSLPQGVYTLQARAPWANATFGHGDKLGTVTIGADGTASLSGALNGLNATALTLQLKNPTWSGTIYSPETTTVSDPPPTPIAFAQICLTISNNWSCATSNAVGEWALSAPSGFANFDSNAVLEIADVQRRSFPALRIEGSAAVSAALGGLTHTGLVHHLPNANVTIEVTAGGQPAAGIWVNFEKTQGGWLGGNQTDSNGIAKFFVNSTDLSQELRIRAEVNGNPNYSTSFSSSSQIISASSRTTLAAGIALATPNIRGVVREPSSGGIAGAIDPYTWVELFKDTGNGGWEWVSGTNTDYQGQFAFYAAPPTIGNTTYIVRVNPPWNSTLTSASKQYNAVIDASSQITMTTRDAVPVVAVPTESRSSGLFYSFTLGLPSASGVVVDPLGAPVQNSWINPFDTVRNQWINGSNSKINGAFGLALNDGSYRVEANPPWGISGVAKSSPCSFSIVGGAISNTVGGCIQADKTVKLQLHAPNVKFVLKSGTDVIANANVGMAYGAWNTWAQSNSQGEVSIYVDSTAIGQLNGLPDGTVVNPYVWVDPPFNSSNKMVRWDCGFTDNSKPLCGNLTSVTVGTEYAVIPTFDVQVAKPNTVLHIKTPNGSAPIGANAWINLYSFDTATANNFHWQGSSSTDSLGDAYFNVDSSTATADTRWGIEINAPWDQRQNYATNYIGGYQQANDWLHGLTWTELNSILLAPLTPNLTLTVKTPAGDALRYSWVSLEELNPQDNSVIAWKNGTGLDFNGRGALLLSGNKRYRVTAYPNGSAGTVTQCVIDASATSPTVLTTAANLCNSGSLVSGALILNLEAGNVTGTVVDGSAVPVAGAVVYAISGTDTSTAVTTSTTSTGRFGFNLDTTKSWNILVIPTGTVYQNASVPPTVPSGNSNATIDLGTITLRNR